MEGDLLVAAKKLFKSPAEQQNMTPEMLMVNWVFKKSCGY